MLHIFEDYINCVWSYIVEEYKSDNWTHLFFKSLKYNFSKLTSVTIYTKYQFNILYKSTVIVTLFRHLDRFLIVLNYIINNFLKLK